MYGDLPWSLAVDKLSHVTLVGTVDVIAPYNALFSDRRARYAFPVESCWLLSQGL